MALTSKTKSSENKMLVQTQVVNLELPSQGLMLQSGEALPEVRVAYETYGTLNPEKSNALLICSPLTTDAHAAGWNDESDTKPGWWNDMIGPGKPIDTNRYFVISSNMLGGCQGTTGPASINPKTGRAYGSSFPRITVEDIVKVQHELVKHLGIDVLEAVVGGSMGGMQALQWSISYPDEIRKCICIAAAACLSAQALGFEIIGRNLIVSDPNYRKGDYYGSQTLPGDGLKFARMIGHLTYLSADGMDARFGRNQKKDFHPERFETGFEVESYLNHQGEKFIERFDANSYLHITYAMDHFDLEKRYGSLDEAFKNTKAEFLLVALSSDWLFPTEQALELARVLIHHRKVVSMVELKSPHGHDAFLLEVKHLGSVINGFLQRPAYSDALQNLNKSQKPVPNGNESVRAAAQKRQRKKDREDQKCFSSDSDYERLKQMIHAGSHILDIGCGDGGLIDRLYATHGVTGIGIDIDLENIVACLKKNIPIMQNDADKGLSIIDNDLFDYAVLNRTLQEMRKPQLVLREMLRVAKKGIVSFPNFGNYHSRIQLLLKGRTPGPGAIKFLWHDAPKAHVFSLEDFRILCHNEGIQIEKTLCVSQSKQSRFLLKCGLKNLGAELVIARISRGIRS